MSERIRFNSHDTDSVSQAVEKAVAVLEQGGVILYPTDTVYGLGCDATNATAIAKVNEIKKRIQPKPQLILASDFAMAEQYGNFNETAKKLAHAFWPGPLTILIPKTSALSDVLTAGSELVGVRVPGHTFCIELVQRLGRPITSTSANISGREQALTFEDILEDFASVEGVGLVIEEIKSNTNININTVSLPSTVVAVDGTIVTIVREGAIKKDAFLAKGFLVQV